MFGSYLYYPPLGQKGQGWPLADNAWEFDAPWRGGAFIDNRLHLLSRKVTSFGAPDSKLETGILDVFEVRD